MTDSFFQTHDWSYKLIINMYITSFQNINSIVMTVLLVCVLRALSVPDKLMSFLQTWILFHYSKVLVCNRKFYSENLTSHCCRVGCEAWRFVTRDDIVT